MVPCGTSAWGEQARATEPRQWPGARGFRLILASLALAKGQLTTVNSPSWPGHEPRLHLKGAVGGT